jgi:hypothetical protein
VDAVGENAGTGFGHGKRTNGVDGRWTSSRAGILSTIGAEYSRKLCYKAMFHSNVDLHTYTAQS